MKPILAPFLLLIAGLLPGAPATAAESAEAPELDAFEFDDTPLAEPLSYPEWFKKSFLFLGDDIEEALDQGKQLRVVLSRAADHRGPSTSKCGSQMRGPR